MKPIFKKAGILFGATALTAAMAVPAFASTTITDGQGTVPVYLTVPATPVDVTIGSGDDVPDNPDGTAGADAIYITGEANSNEASVTPLHVKNNNSSAPVYVKGIILNNVTSGYTLAAYSDDFSAKQADSKEFGVALTSASGLTPAGTISTTDLKTGYTSTGDSIAASGEGVYNLSGKVAVTTTEIAKWAKVADCVVTVAMTPAA